MKEQTERIQKIESHYVGDDCIQVGIPYQDKITILNQDGILFHYKDGSSFYINKYLEDERKYQFPYSNIPTSIQKIGLFEEKAFANQLLEFERPYIEIANGTILERFVVKDNQNALLIKSIMQPKTKHTKYMTYDELLKYVDKNECDDEVYYVNLDGSMYRNHHEVYPSEEKIYNYIESQLKRNISVLRDVNSTLGLYLRNNPIFLNYIEASINHIDFSLINFNLKIGNDTVVVRMSNGNITMQYLDVTFIKQDDFKVEIYDIPTNKYTLEQLRDASQVHMTKEPKIPFKLNPSINKQDVLEAKQMVKTLRKQNRTKIS